MLTQFRLVVVCMNIKDKNGNTVTGSDDDEYLADVFPSMETTQKKYMKQILSWCKHKRNLNLRFTNPILFSITIFFCDLSRVAEKDDSSFIENPWKLRAEAYIVTNVNGQSAIECSFVCSPSFASSLYA